MKGLAYLLVLGILISGCATVNYTVGQDFDNAAVERIENGKTTTEQLLAWFGPPDTKSVTKSSTFEDIQTWSYTHTDVNSNAYAFLFLVHSQAEVTLKMLTISIKGNLVTNYTYTETKTESQLGQ